MSPEVERLADDECWDLLKRTDVGRLAVQAGEGVDVLPVNFAVHKGAIVLRSTHGEKLLDLAIRPQVAFGINGRDGWQLWSVALKGLARTPESGIELEELHGLGLASYSPLAKSAYVVIDPLSVSGCRFAKRLEQDRDWR